MDKFTKISKILNEFGNCSAGIAAYESPAKPFKKTPTKKKIDWAARLKRLKERRGDPDDIDYSTT